MAEQPSSPPDRPGPSPQPAEAGPAGAGGDPSMEDILASIRRILNEDEPTSPGPSPPPSPPAAEEPLDLTREMLVGGTPAVSPPPPGAPAHEPMADAEPLAPAAPAPSVAPAAAMAATAAAATAGALLAPAAAAAASASVGHLLRAVAAGRGSAVRAGGPTIEDVVREELRPLLKDWLDQHLPAVVERLVRAEIERVVGRALS